MSSCLILAAGVGSRMHNAHIHKGLLPISGKAIISHIIDNVVCEEFIIAVGYKSQQIKDYCGSAHPNTKITFVDVANFDGPNSGPGHSMFCCKDHLQKPFYLVTADSLLTDKLPPIDFDWAGISNVENLENYATCSLDDDEYINKFKNKDKINSFDYAFTGVLAVRDYTAFWRTFENYKKNRTDKEVEVVGTLYSPGFAKLKGIFISWQDVGTKELYDRAKTNSKSFAPFELEKINVNECTFKINNKIIKIAPEISVYKKKQRASILKDVIPEIMDCSFANLISYKFINGQALYEHDSFEIYKNFLIWCEANLFVKKITNIDLKKQCNYFYQEKTKSRVELYSRQNKDSAKQKFTINDVPCASVEEIFSVIDWERFQELNIPCAFHGDLNFGNAILSDSGNYYLIDWRDEFEGQNYGDLYYDLAKLYAGADVNFMKFCLSDNLITSENDKIYIQDCSTNNTRKFIQYYESWIKDQKYDLEHIKILSALSYINMSPLHPEYYGDYLFYKGILHLNKLVME